MSIPEQANAFEADPRGAVRAPVILPLRGKVTAEEVEAACPPDRDIVACDFYITRAELGVRVPGGLQLGRILNCDHHAPLVEMQVHMTSTRLAHELMDSRALDGTAPSVVINHTDCDSVLSSAMVMGHVEATQQLVDASVCADHTGKANDIADMLQALDEGRSGDRTGDQYLESLRNLRLLLSGQGLEPNAAAALERHRGRRELARRLIGEGNVSLDGGLAVIEVEREIDGAFFPALLPDASVIMLVAPDAREDGRWLVKLRLGLGTSDAFTLHDLAIQEWDANFGGRWNAGSNKRSGGTHLAPARYAARLRARISERRDGLTV